MSADRRKILCIGTTPAAQRVMVFKQLKNNAVNRAVETLNGSAGKSVNVAKVLKALGEHPVALGFLGGIHGDSIQADLHARGIEERFTRVAVPTRLCITVIDTERQEQTELVEESRMVGPEAFEALFSAIRETAPECRAFVMSGTVAPGAPKGFYRSCIAIARSTGNLSVLDASGPALLDSLPGHPGLVKPNRSELAVSVGHPLHGEQETMEAMRTMRDRGAERVVVTAGADPTLAFDGSTFWRVNSPQIKACNPIGSGDSFTAALAARLVHGDDLGEACRWGAAAGAANALSLMPGELELAQVAGLLKTTVCERIS
jgi:tagatose 6-phosphate kinase